MLLCLLGLAGNQRGSFERGPMLQDQSHCWGKPTVHGEHLIVRVRRRAHGKGCGVDNAFGCTGGHSGRSRRLLSFEQHRGRRCSSILGELPPQVQNLSGARVRLNISGFSWPAESRRASQSPGGTGSLKMEPHAEGLLRGL